MYSERPEGSKNSTYNHYTYTYLLDKQKSTGKHRVVRNSIHIIYFQNKYINKSRVTYIPYLSKRMYFEDTIWPRNLS